MGERGPVPKRSEERAGHRAAADKPDQVALSKRVSIPAASREWHPQASRWYRSLRRSGQVRFFEPSDWAEAHLLADLLTRELSAVRVATLPTGDQVIVPVAPRANMIRNILAAMGDLGTTESARRRMRIEVNRGSGDVSGDVSITVLDDYRDAFTG